MFVSGLLTHLGLTPAAALIALQPVAVFALFFAVRAFVLHNVADPALARAALVTALFFGTGAVVGDEWLPFLSWGYLPATFAVALTAAGITAFQTARQASRPAWAAGLCALLACWLHPWQGEQILLTTLICVVVPLASSRMLSRSTAQRWHLPCAAPVLAGAVIPLIYYVILDRFDLTWRLAGEAGQLPRSLSTCLIPLLPLIGVAVLGLLPRAGRRIDLPVLAWILSTPLIWLTCSLGFGEAPLHAFSWVTIPLAVCAVTGVSSASGDRRRLATAVALTGALVFAALATETMVSAIPSYLAPNQRRGNLITHAEASALDLLRRERSSGVILASEELSQLIPEVTGRAVVWSSQYWSVPDPRARFDALFDAFDQSGRSRGSVESLLRQTRPTAAVVDCDAGPGVLRVLHRRFRRITRFGCVEVFSR